jgi:RHS repeat-associated protein
MASGLVNHTRQFDLSGRIVRYPLGNVLRDVSYDAADRITGFTHLSSSDGTPQPALNQGFGYDENSRLTSIITSASSWSIAYDPNGNRTSVSLNGSQSDYTTETTSNRLTSITNPARSFTYDNAGNTTVDSANYTATYGLNGAIASITKAGVTGSYDYDADRRRIRKVTSTGGVVIFAYNLEGQLLGEYDQTGKPLREYVWLDNIPVAMFMPDPTNASNPPLIYYIQADHLNAPRIVVDQSGAKRWRWLAEPFGTTAPETNPEGLGTFTQNLRFPGQYADAESGLWYNYFRTYDSSRGGYAQSDPIGLVAGSLSTFSYVDSSPLDAVDPEGLKSGNYIRPSPGPDYDPTLIRHSLGPKYDNLRFRQKCERAPDFVNFQIDAYVFSIWGTFTRDGNSFVGGGLNRSFVNPLNLSASATAGWLNRRTVAPGDTNSFAGGYSGSAAAAFVGLGGGVMVSPGNGTATIVGLGAGYTKGPSWKGSAAVGGGYSGDMGETGLAWPADACSCTK